MVLLQGSDYLLFVVLLMALIWDIRFNKLPNWLTAGAMILGILYHLIMSGIDGLVFSFIGLLAGGGIFLILYLFKAIGAGDVKLFAAIGAITGVPMVFYFMMYSVVFAGVIGIILLLFMKTFLRNFLNMLFNFVNSLPSGKLKDLREFDINKTTRFPFMYAVIPAVIVTYYYNFM
ncbi:peptidase A24A prepilin type IV [Oceanobacillus picturae]|jgi:prepilin peptidase CpaA|uniref:Peptidase A24A prepilin type IV n=1 Tax=Oceanobacillus picturae TaxID=171693 RepID=A0A0U9HBE1_9BACI|nr:prepilin peptidase [Oceanobacillus picturae]GAQ19906.1 peptidase A24A prepilin type IV [Oceanobacillus picturae]